MRFICEQLIWFNFDYLISINDVKYAWFDGTWGSDIESTLLWWTEFQNLNIVKLIYILKNNIFIIEADCHVVAIGIVTWRSKSNVLALIILQLSLIIVELIILYCFCVATVDQNPRVHHFIELSYLYLPPRVCHYRSFLPPRLRIWSFYRGFWRWQNCGFHAHVVEIEIILIFFHRSVYCPYGALNHIIHWAIYWDSE